MLEASIWGDRGYALRAAVGAVVGLIGGHLSRDALFANVHNSDYPASAYALLYGLSFLGAGIITMVPWRIGSQGNGQEVKGQDFASIRQIGKKSRRAKF